ncbi:Homoserine dehydrogenase [Gaiella occulta]|uniref:Homoserine dehydrogenase n=1 Tax=Gaiella occulta TaxID=1002870 RepID=A0A7M2Z1G7_9ACTN|nr:homoserine dehydrogenase [Gaiella occulta]RDI75632.1 Homoserine dehydrogenase [Gaiella occulta]
MASVDVPVALLGYGTVGAAVHRLLEESADEIERATGHRLRVTRALVRDTSKDRGFSPEPGVLSDDFATIRDDPAIQVVAEVMGGVDPAGDYVLELLRAGRPVVTANKQLVARRGAELFEAAAAGGVQLRFEASVCAAIPVIKVLRESLVVTNVHRVLGIVNGTTNLILSAMEGGRPYGEALAEAQRLGFAEADPTEDVAGIDAAAKTAILATVAFGTRVPLDWVDVEGIEHVTLDHVVAARALDMHLKLIGRATLVGDRVDVRVGPAFVDRHHPLAAVEGAFNAVMLQGDAIREITLEGPGAGGIETASAVVADMVSVVGTTGTGFLQNDPVWRKLERLPAGDLTSPFYLRLEVDDRAGVLARIAHELAAEGVSVARLVQQPGDGHAVLHVVTHEAPAGRVEAALTAIRALPESRGEASALPVVSDRGVEELGWT